MSNSKMVFRKRAVWVLGLAGAVAVSLALITFLAVQTQQWMLRWRAERLLADMHQIRHYQSTWADAQRLMHRWGAWGHYDGSCAAASCTYVIEMDSVDRYNPRVSRPAWMVWLLRHDRLNLYQWFGGRLSVFRASFTVHDGTIWRESTSMGVSVPERRIRQADYGDFDWTLVIGAESYQRLDGTDGMHITIGSDDQLAIHPYYRVWRPSGCKVLCQLIVVYYSTHTPPAEIERLTSYDFSCFTRFHPCARMVDLLPAAEEWHLYDGEYESSPTVLVPKERPLSEYSLPSHPPCSKIPVWALARDAHYVLAVEALSTKIVKNQENDREYRKIVKVRVVSSLKDPAPWPPGAIANADTLEWFDKDWLSSQYIPLIPGRRYIVFATDRPGLVAKHLPITFERCGVQEDTPEIRRELEKGFAQNDTLRP